jgi:hypothetical protein
MPLYTGIRRRLPPAPQVRHHLGASRLSPTLPCYASAHLQILAVLPHVLRLLFRFPVSMIESASVFFGAEVTLAPVIASSNEEVAALVASTDSLPQRIGRQRVDHTLKFIAVLYCHPGERIGIEILRFV